MEGVEQCGARGPRFLGSPGAVTTGRRLSSPRDPLRQEHDFADARPDSTTVPERPAQAHCSTAPAPLVALRSGLLDSGSRGDGSRRGSRPRPPCLEALSPLTSRRGQLRAAFTSTRCRRCRTQHAEEGAGAARGGARRQHADWPALLVGSPHRYCWLLGASIPRKRTIDLRAKLAQDADLLTATPANLSPFRVSVRGSLPATQKKGRRAQGHLKTD
ncbi:uncharacterized protein LOC121456357 [Microtus oregoni]|uniref:uncharacterized protein LOC121456357 n=1 Tax=Microtus oregoni TaxID=111838 RepID=UPI001BB1F4E1|nr:uncharacterized protein LOC121456357 [Microtus oregoni]